MAFSSDRCFWHFCIRMSMLSVKISRFGRTGALHVDCVGREKKIRLIIKLVSLWPQFRLPVHKFEKAYTRFHLVTAGNEGSKSLLSKLWKMHCKNKATLLTGCLFTISIVQTLDCKVSQAADRGANCLRFKTPNFRF